MRFAFLNASHNDAATARNFRREMSASLAEFDVTEGSLPNSTDYDGIVVTGSRSSVYWDEDWIESTAEYIERAHTKGVPVLGICFGHQLLAHSLGGEVNDMGTYELGYRRINQVAEDPIWADVPDPLYAFTTHSDTVDSLPTSADLLAENDYGIQAFRLDHSIGLQFHPEYDMETARAVTERKELPEDRIQSVLEGITDVAYEKATKTKAVFDNFERQVQDTPTNVA